MSLVIWSVVVIYAFSGMKSMASVFGMEQRQLEFWVLGFVIALVMGGSQALSRSMFSQMIPKDQEAQFYAFYEVSERGTSWMGTFIFGLVNQIFGSLRLGVLSVLPIGAVWVVLPHHFPPLGGLVPNWFHEFVGSTLGEAPPAVAFSVVPLLTSVGVALTGLVLGWLVYRRVPAGAPDPVAQALGPLHKVLKNKYYFDDIYDFILVRPLRWFGEVFVYQWMDRGLIDGLLHAIGRFAAAVGSFLRRAIDLPLVNGFGDMVGAGTKRAGQSLRVLQTGRVQQYLLIGLINVVVVGALLFYLSALRP
jgi:NADH:ubiquinone oxidoreductase subunit 5 (subunit L)/multisubunit Na+/H+ antiporter MnhA subunit